MSWRSASTSTSDAELACGGARDRPDRHDAGSFGKAVPPAERLEQKFRTVDELVNVT